MPPKNPQDVQRVLIYRLGSIGDMVVALPALHLVARTFPNAERRLLTSFPAHAKAAPSAAVLEGSGLVHGYVRYNYGTRSPRELFRLWWQLARWRPDVLVYIGGSRGVASAKRDALFFRFCGIPRLVGIPDTEDTQFPREETDPGTGESFFEPEAARLVRNLAELGPAPLDDPGSWDLRLTSAEHARAAEVLAPAGNRPILAASIGTKMQAKDWGPENWRALLARLAELYPGYALALCGAPEERQTSDDAASGWREAGPVAPILNLCGALSPRESAAVFARAALFIGHDSGPMHLAAAVGTPCVAIFASRNLPRVWFPFGRAHRVLYHHVSCQGCNLETCIVERKRCILSITVDEVLAEVAHILPQPLAVLPS